MKKYLRFFLWHYLPFVCTAVALLLLLYVGVRLHSYFSYAEEQSMEVSVNAKSDTLTVVFIGDSWATYHQPHTQLLAQMLENRTGRKTCVKSHGLVGAKTKTIYEALYDSIGGFRKFLTMCPDYCILSAGINDAVAGIGPANYCYHYRLVLRQLLALGITPVVLDMPNVGYGAVRQRESLLVKIRHHLFHLWTGTADLCFDDYRSSLKKMLRKDGLGTRVVYIPNGKWNANGFTDDRNLYLRDSIHLSAKGYAVLDSCLAESVGSLFLP